MRIDLHTHTSRSDGTVTPAELVRAARASGLDVVALTDHDTAVGWDEAATVAQGTGMTLVRGMEVSCRWQGSGVHLLAYLMDPEYPPLAVELERILAGRNSRLPATLERLRNLGIDIEAKDVRRVAGPAAALGRPHVADALVDQGVVADRGEAFDRYLGPGGPAYVNRYAADLVATIEMVTAAGGVSVIAHPWASRHNHSALDERGLSALRDIGLAGVEVDHQDHDADRRARLRAVARDLDLIVTGASDFHGTGKKNHELGCNTTAPEHYARLVELATRTSAASGRATPDIVAA